MNDVVFVAVQSMNLIRDILKLKLFPPKTAGFLPCLLCISSSS